jgi:hypothetical protein
MTTPNVTTTAPLDIRVYSGVELTQAELLPLTRAECAIIEAVRQAIQTGRTWMLILEGNDAGTKIVGTKAPKWVRWDRSE